MSTIADAPAGARPTTDASASPVASSGELPTTAWSPNACFSRAGGSTTSPVFRHMAYELAPDARHLLGVPSH